MQRQDLNFNNYYKGKTLMTDLNSFFLVKGISTAIGEGE